MSIITPTATDHGLGAGITPSGLMLDGEEQVVLCASLFYFRIPRELWASRLQQVRASGYRAIDVYVPWNFHELAPGEWDFSGRRDVAAFLDLAHEAGLVVIARPGPYICSEWDGGALPAWLTLDPELRIRQDEPRFLAQVAAWFDQVVPLLAEREAHRGGAVVAIQLENELDFFDTANRGGYVGALRQMALKHGVTVPLIGCAGQGDLHGATGDVDGVIPACNFYPSDASPDIEAEVRHYRDVLAARGMPLMVTETNRLHVTLRRLLASGASVIAPYLQASGYNFGFTPSVGNWGDPAGLMTHDYDFGGFLSPVGEPRPEMVEARVLAAVARTLGSALARGLPEDATGSYRTAALTSSSPSRVVLDGGGWLLGAPNLSEVDSQVTLNHTLGDVTVPLRAGTCLLVTGELPLARWGLEGVLELATADVVGLDSAGITLAATTESVLVLADDAGNRVRVDLPAPQPGAPLRQTATAGSASWEVLVLHAQDVPGPDGAVPAPASRAVIEASGAVAEITSLAPIARPALPESVRHGVVPTAEAVSVFRGRVHYGLDISSVTELLIEGAGDIVDVALDGAAHSTLTPYGASVLVDVAGADRLNITTEIWGHANFDDVRLPGLGLGAQRGLGRAFAVVDRQDVGALWTVEGTLDPSQSKQWPGSPAPIRSLGGWSSTRVGRNLTYRRTLDLDAQSHHALHLAGLAATVAVEVEGVATWVTPENPSKHSLRLEEWQRAPLHRSVAQDRSVAQV